MKLCQPFYLGDITLINKQGGVALCFHLGVIFLLLSPVQYLIFVFHLEMCMCKLISATQKFKYEAKSSVSRCLSSPVHPQFLLQFFFLIFFFLQPLETHLSLHRCALSDLCQDHRFKKCSVSDHRSVYDSVRETGKRGICYCAAFFVSDAGWIFLSELLLKW